MATKLAEYIKWEGAMPAEGLVVFNGRRRLGKTRTAWGMAEVLHDKKGRDVTAYRFPVGLHHLLPDWVNHANTLAELQRCEGHVIVADELGVEAHARDHSSANNREWAKWLAIIAQFHHLVLAIYQHSRQMELSLAMDGDLAVLKEPSELHIRFARPELRPELKEAQRRFRECKQDPRGFAFIVNWHTGEVGFVRTPSPSFWSEGISTAYAQAQLDGPRVLTSVRRSAA